MAIQKISASEVEKKILDIYKANGGSRKERMATLDQIADYAKGLLSNLNSADDTIVDIIDDLDDVSEQLKNMQSEFDTLSNDIQTSQEEIDDIDAEIENLEAIPPEDLTAEENKRLIELYKQKDGKSSSLKASQQNLNKTSGSMGSLSTKLNSYNAEIDNILEVMDSYTEAGEIIRDSANKYGKKNMNVDKALDRNETSWFNFFDKNGDDNKNSKFAKHIERSGYTQETENTYYDSSNNEFITRFDIIEDKGGNDIGGKMRTKTAKVWSYGQTVSDASSIVKKKAEKADTD